LTNLIYKNYIKGYIIHGVSIVFSKKEPFPELKDVYIDKI